MLKTRMKRLAHREKDAAQRLAQIETSLRELGNEDLLDLADIVEDQSENPLRDIAAAEMKRRGIHL